MKFELKSVKYAAFASEETHCFEATLYVDGKPFCKVSNEGHGGPNQYWPLPKANENNRAVYDRVAEIDKELGKEQIDVDGTGKYFVENSLEIVVGDLMNEWLTDKDLKRLFKKVVYIRDGQVFNLPAKFKATPENLQKVKQAAWWKPGIILLNELPFDKAKAELKRVNFL